MSTAESTRGATREPVTGASGFDSEVQQPQTVAQAVPARFITEQAEASLAEANVPTIATRAIRRGRRSRNVKISIRLETEGARHENAGIRP
jgi:hypothetical protein